MHLWCRRRPQIERKRDVVTSPSVTAYKIPEVGQRNIPHFEDFFFSLLWRYLHVWSGGERERESQARGDIRNVSFYMTYWGKAGAGFSSINYGSLPVSVADNRPPTIHLLVSSLRHFPYMHMYNDVFSLQRRGKEDGGWRMEDEDRRGGQLFPQTLFSELKHTPFTACQSRWGRR